MIARASQVSKLDHLLCLVIYLRCPALGHIHLNLRALRVDLSNYRPLQVCLHLLIRCPLLHYLTSLLLVLSNERIPKHANKKDQFRKSSDPE